MPETISAAPHWSITTALALMVIFSFLNALMNFSTWMRGKRVEASLSESDSRMTKTIEKLTETLIKINESLIHNQHEHKLMMKMFSRDGD